MGGIAILVMVIFGIMLFKNLFKSSVSALEEDAPRIVKNSASGAANASDSLPTMGASFTASVIADSLEDVTKLKQQMGITDDNLKTMKQLHAYMRENNML